MKLVSGVEDGRGWFGRRGVAVGEAGDRAAVWEGDLVNGISRAALFEIEVVF